MHGRMKIRTPEEQQEVIRKEKEKKLAQFKHMFDDIIAKRKQSDASCETLQALELLLSRCPDIYTLWNYRREILLDHLEKSESDAKINGICMYELSFTESCLTEDPKSYSTWYHRRWTLGQMKNPDWPRELGLCDKALQLDERNFHCWDFRRFVVKNGNIPLEKELEFSTSLIKRNFSNYSSWHYRTVLLPVLFPEKVPEAQIKEDLNLVLNAVFTDPNDQSAWFYCVFLVDQIKKGEYTDLMGKLVDNVKELCEEEPENEWVLHGTVQLLLNSGIQLTDDEVIFLRETLVKLGDLDPLRRGYYESLRLQVEVIPKR